MLDEDVVKLGLETGLGDSAAGYRAAADHMKPVGPSAARDPGTDC